jgi:hypothetical protein
MLAQRGRRGTIVIIAILHTWTQKMTYHPHIHCIVPAGALAPDGMEWVRSRGRFLFPAQVLRKLYRGKMMELFRESVKKGSIALEPEANDAPGAFRDMVAALYSEEWVVYLKESFIAPDSIIKYLSSYINRIAISDKRIVAINGEMVTFSYSDRTDGNTRKLLTIPLTKFISRFLLHAVPGGVVIPFFKRKVSSVFHADSCIGRFVIPFFKRKVSSVFHADSTIARFRPHTLLRCSCQP